MTNNEQEPFRESTINNEQFNQPTDDERLYGMLIYLTSFFTTLIAPLIIWLIKREDSPFVDRVGKDFLNFFISYTIWMIVASLLMLLLIGFVIAPILVILCFVFTIIGAVKSYNGETYLPPLTIRMIK